MVMYAYEFIIYLRNIHTNFYKLKGNTIILISTSRA